MTSRARQLLVAAMLAFVALVLAASGGAVADAGWTINSFDATYAIGPDGAVRVIEDIQVDFGSLQKHGIFRDIPVRYRYDTKHDRLITVDNVTVQQNGGRARWDQQNSGANLRLKIGDPNQTISGRQRYTISYRMTGALNPFDDHDELYMNVTGNDWEASIEKASATVTGPSSKVNCFQGPTGSTTPCAASPGPGGESRFVATQSLAPGSGLTFTLALPKGAVAVPPPHLVEIKSAGEQVRDFLGLFPPQMALTVLVAAAVIAGLGRLWWTNGRDRWFGDVQYLTGATRESTRPLFAHETIVPEFTPPELDGTKRPLRPAEVGVLMDERADTLDVSATIVDLAVRGYLKITDLGKTGLLGMGGRDYELERLKANDSDLLGYEAELLNALFESGEKVKLSDLKNKFASDLAEMKTELYRATTQDDAIFAGNPESGRTLYRVGGIVLAAAGAGIVFVLGLMGAGIVGVPLFLPHPLSARRRHATTHRPRAGGFPASLLGFREYMVTAETDRQKFNEEANIFDKYLPYAIVFHCTEQWAKRFEGLEGGAGARPGGWYVSPNPFIPLAFASDINSFSSHVSDVIASTPGGSGGSGFSGGFSGGGVGGGGGGSW